MWALDKVKAVGKASFKRNYWKAVLVSFVLSILGVSYGWGASSNAAQSEYSSSGREDAFQFGPGHDLSLLALITILLGTTIFTLLVLAIGLLIKVFVVNPVEIGGCRFYFRNLREQSQLKEITFAYDHPAYKNVVRTLFFRDLYVFLWTLLFIIPGIIKSYEYMMIPYLLSDNPDMSMEEAFAESRRMMDGEKWNAFVLDLSFFGWILLAAITGGIFGLFYTFPYMNQTHAALYDALRILKPRNENSGYSQF